MPTTKIRLPARVPNEGARRLAWWLMNQPAGTYDRMLRKLGIGQISMERMLAGELAPGREQGFMIYGFAGQSVPIGEWYRAAEGGWFDRPVDRAALRKAA
jgi:hypothetical protein